MSVSEDQARAFRTALGRFVTGVTIITTRAQDGRPVGVTANSFSSLSLDPPLVLWSLARTSSQFEHFCNAPAFAVSILGRGQEDLCQQFSRKDIDRFAGLDCPTGYGDVPLIPDAIASFECRTAEHYAGGDHVIFVGQVENFSSRDGAPLVFAGGRFCGTSEEPLERPDPNL